MKQSLLMPDKWLQLLKILLAAAGLRGVAEKVLVHFEEADISEPILLQLGLAASRSRHAKAASTKLPKP